MMVLYDIPAHTNCVNCGKCCGLVPATIREVEEIRKWMARNNVQPIRQENQAVCPFRDEPHKRCLIYPVRPVVCRLFGVTSGVMQCPNGNSNSIDGSRFLPEQDEIVVLNLLEW